VPLNRTAIDIKAIANWFQSVGQWLNWNPLHKFSGDNDKRINLWPAHRELPWKCQPSADRELAKSFTAAITKT
jgi:hypothetical protein